MFGKKSIPTFGRRSMFGGFAKASSTMTSAEKIEVPLDQKCETILNEMERCKGWSHRHIESSILHGVPQIFVTKDLYDELEGELDRLLMEQLIQDEQKIHSSSPLGELIIHENPDEHQNDVNFCAACNESPCGWKPSCNTDELAKRKKELYRELAAQMQRDKTGVLNKGGGNIVPSDSIEILSNEIKSIDASIALCSIDRELHQVYATANESVTVSSIHGFPTTVQRDNAIHALEFEHNRLVAKELATETIESVLDWMLQGWYFGEPDDDEQTITWADEVSSQEERTTLRSKAHIIQLSSDADKIRASNVKEDNDEFKSIENRLRYGIFCLTFMYFRALHLVRREKETWRGAHDAVTMARRTPLSAERLKMIEEERNAAYRKARMDKAMEKARKGEERKRLRLERERLEEVSSSVVSILLNVLHSL